MAGKLLILTVALTLAAAVPCASAGEFSMWFGDVVGNHLTHVERADGELLNVYVWLSTTVNTWFVEAAVGFDTAAQEGPAAPLDGKLVLAHNSPAEDMVWFDAALTYDMMVARRLAGFYSPGQTIRPYGAEVARARMSGYTPAMTAAKFVCVKLKSRLGPGESYTIVLWNEGSNTAGDLNTMVMGNLTAPWFGVSDTLLVEAGPPTVAVTGRAAGDAVVPEAGDNFRFVVFGRVLSQGLTADEFVLDDGSGIPVKVVAPGHGLAQGQFVRAKGILATGSPVTLQSSADRIAVYP